MAYAAYVIVSQAHVLPSILLRHADDLQRLVEVLKLHLLCRQVTALLKPLDGRRGSGGGGGTRT